MLLLFMSGHMELAVEKGCGGGVNLKKYVCACACMRACVHVYACVHVCVPAPHVWCVCSHMHLHAQGPETEADVMSLSALVLSVSVSHWLWNEAGAQEITAITLSPPPATPRLWVYGHAWLFTSILRFRLRSSCLCSNCQPTVMPPAPHVLFKVVTWIYLGDTSKGSIVG